MSFSPSGFGKKLRVKRLQKGPFAIAIGVPPSYISQYLNGLRVPTDEISRRIEFVFTFIYSQEMTGEGFALDRAGVRLLQKRIKGMERSIVRSNRPANNDAPAEENAPCPAN
jgi:transcriptional regulator with XRE-family HTH domain